MEFYLLNITSWLESHQIPCIFKSFTHMDCPGCGVQRSFVLLLQGDVPGSFIMYPALMPILLLFAFLILHVILKIRNGANILKYMYIFCTGIILVSYIYKLLVTKTT
ncbi:MAG: DUF2752 domain-containing protein [Chitinophagaceae bacterium]|nr:DUF2752 domain-containing protein [Chitinophagaceae bacterium]MBK8787673.1 DUF2752 domain-containing protein [Chitinophagaceae bacterium]MBK9484885.1 DUF2752 domain-containing protein [Chitinophagaceae bacterium]